MKKLPDFPDEFVAFLDSHRGEYDYEFNDIEWSVATRSELLTTVNIDGAHYPFFQQLAGYAKSMAALSDAGDAAHTEDGDGNDYPLARLASGLAFATGSGDVLYFDPEDAFSIWQFEHDGGDVERVATGFSDWLNSAVPQTD